MTQTPTQDQAVLEYLLLGLPLTQYTANYRLKPAVSRLAAVINRLEQKRGWLGWIKHEDKTIKNNGVVKNITVYKL